jgi:transcriptional regulator with XRE-family HTH domain
VNAAERFGENLSRLREQANLTRTELAARAALHPSEIEKLERGERLPMLHTAIKLAGSLRVSVGRLIEGIDLGGED